MVANDYEVLDQEFETAKNAADFGDRYLLQHIRAIKSLNMNAVEKVINHITEARDRGNTIYVCGNGGKATLADEFVNDLTSAIPLSRIKAHTLLDTMAGVTGVANDHGYEEIFARRLAALGKHGDILVALSGSGTSENILRAVSIAKNLNMYVISVGRGDVLADEADLPILIDADEDGPVEDVTLMLIHIIHAWFLRLDEA